MIKVAPALWRRSKTSVQIAAPAELVFAFFCSAAACPYWYGAEMEACIEVQGGALGLCRRSEKCAVTGRVGAAAKVSHNRCGHCISPGGALVRMAIRRSPTA